jgi:hypothetical protein
VRTNLTRNLASAFASLWHEHKTVRREYAFLISKGERTLARRLYQARENDAHFSECIGLERQLSKSDRLYAVRLVRYGLRVGEIIDEVDRLLRRGIRRNQHHEKRKGTRS